MVSPASYQTRLVNILRWLRTAKENLPAISDGRVSSDQVARASGLIDRIHAEAMRLAEREFPGDAAAVMSQLDEQVTGRVAARDEKIEREAPAAAREQRVA